MLKELIKKNRSYRRFNEYEKVSMNTLKELVNLARLSASAANIQPLRYILSNRKKTNKKIFDCITWAKGLKSWDGPQTGNRPTAYIIILKDNNFTHDVNCDAGISSQSILLGAVEKGLGGCILASVDKKKLKDDLDISDEYEILYVLAVGKPNETVKIVKANKEGDTNYWRDKKDVHYVPKRSINQIIIEQHED